MATRMATRRETIEKLLAEPHEWNSLACECLHCAASVGFVIGTKNEQGVEGIRLGSITLIPSLYPRSVYEEALELQPLYNELYHKVAHDYPYMKNALSSVIIGDEFTAKLWSIYQTVIDEGFGSPVSLGIFRSDYMYQLKDDHFSIAQIEQNTMASSMAMLSTQAQLVHKYLGNLVANDVIDTSKMPTNDSLPVIAQGMIEAWKMYGEEKAAILILIHQGENNIADIRRIQYEIIKCRPNVKVIAHTALSMRTCATLDDNKKLIIEGVEVGVVYFRTYYSPDHYTDEKDWQIRLLMERSKAIKCPSIHYQLAGSKKIQQDLARAGAVERFLSPEKAKKIRNSFVGLYSLNEDPEIINKAIESPENYVLKPQREGGGNNYYGPDIVTKLNEIRNTAERDAYILMERVRPPTQYNCKLQDCDLSNCKCIRTISELGIYGSVIGTAEGIVHNTTGGYLLRTKPENTNEGGFYVGFSSIDTPQLTEDKKMVSFVVSSAKEC